jgi:hypothetical protein
MTDAAIQTFIDRWSPSGGAKRANYGLFLSELSSILEVPRPEPSLPDDDQNAYVFDRQVIFQNPDGTPILRLHRSLQARLLRPRIQARRGKEGR